MKCDMSHIDIEFAFESDFEVANTVKSLKNS